MLPQRHVEQENQQGEHDNTANGDNTPIQPARSALQLNGRSYLGVTRVTAQLLALDRGCDQVSNLRKKPFL
jgi:hypothetical protein